MSINRVDLQGALMRTSDMSTIRQNEENKAALHQANFQTHFSKETDHNSERVQETKEKGNAEFYFDAKEKSNNEYSGDGGRRKGEAQEKEAGLVGREGKVIRQDIHSSFDFKV